MRAALAPTVEMSWPEAIFPLAQALELVLSKKKRLIA